MAELQTQRIKPAFEGWNTEAAPDYVTDVQAPLVQNLLCRPGKLVMRGPITSSLNVVAADSSMWGQMVRGNEALLYLKNTSTLVEGAYHVNIDTAVVTSLGAMTLAAGKRWVNYDNTIYLDAGRFRRWTGGAVLPTDYAVGNAPHNASDIAVHAERVFSGGGYLGPSTPSGTRNLYYSVPGGPTTATLADWQDPVSGLTNLIVVGRDEDDPIVALASVGSNLAILKRRSLWLLTGTGSTTFAARQFSADLGCIDAHSVVSRGDGCYFLSDSGYFYWDGAQLEDVSRSVSTSLTNAVDDVYGLQTNAWSTDRIVAGINTQAVVIEPDVILLSIGTDTTPGQFCAMYDYKRQAWSQFSSDSLFRDAPSSFVAFKSKRAAWDGKNLAYLNNVSLPAPTTTGIDTVNAVSTAIPVKWHSRLARLASPANAAQLHRLLLDYKFQLAAGADDSANGWFVTLVGGDGTTLLTEFQVPAQGSTTAYLYRRRSTKDVFNEAVDAQLRVEWRGSGTSLLSAELYDATLEFQSGRQRAAA